VTVTCFLSFVHNKELFYQKKYIAFKQLLLLQIVRTAEKLFQEEERLNSFVNFDKCTYTTNGLNQFSRILENSMK
jgi:hypothetical protein